MVMPYTHAMVTLYLTHIGLDSESQSLKPTILPDVYIEGFFPCPVETRNIPQNPSKATIVVEIRLQANLILHSMIDHPIMVYTCDVISTTRNEVNDIWSNYSQDHIICKVTCDIPMHGEYLGSEIIIFVSHK